MAKKGSAGKKRQLSKKQFQKKSQNAFEIALKEEQVANGEVDADSGNGRSKRSSGTVVNLKKRMQNRASGRDVNESEEDDSEEFEDEEIDSDEALGSDDEYDVLNSKFSQTIRDKAKAKKDKLKQKKRQSSYEADDVSGEEDEEYDSIDESELVPLSAVWDMDDKDLSRSKSKSNAGSQDLVLDDNDEDSEDDEEGDSDSDLGDLGDSSEEEVSDSNSDLVSDSDSDSESDVFANESDQDEEVELTSLKQSLAKKHAKSKLQYQGFQTSENELSLPGGGSDITLADMLSVVDTDTALKAVLVDNRDDSNNKSLSVPLPKRIQQRQDRKAAYEISKDEVNKWKDTVRENRDAEVLKFPMNKPADIGGSQKASTFSEISDLTELEKKVNTVLKDSKLYDDKAEATFEEIATAKMSKEELQKRTNELRKMRELMFRNERDAKRIKKIKSKSFHRVKKREMLRNKQLVEGDEDGEEVEDIEAHDTKRAMERMSLKHRNNSKWSKNLIKSGLSKDEANRDELEEMMRRDQQLRSKILDRGGDDSDDDDGYKFDLDKDLADYESDTELRENLGKTGVLNMAFMKNAEAKERQENQKNLENLRNLEKNGDLDSFKNAELNINNAINSNINAGRRVYEPQVDASNKEISELNEDVLKEDSIDNSKNLVSQISRKSKVVKEQEDKQQDRETKETHEQDEDEDGANPWLNDDSNVVKSRKLRVVDQNSSKSDKLANKIAKQKKRKHADVDVEDEFIDMNSTIKVSSKVGAESDNDDDEMADNHNSDVKDADVHMFTQKELIEQAFAGDDVISEFSKEKRKLIEEEGDKVEDLTLPGWGDWTGGNKKVKKNRFVKKTKGVKENERKDRNKANVIINEKLNKKNAKYLSSSVPFPYENKEQYERSLRMPIGNEWTSRETHQKLTMPKVIVKTGVVIDPLKAPFK